MKPKKLEKPMTKEEAIEKVKDDMGHIFRSVIPKEFKNDKDVVMAAVKGGCNFYFINKTYKSDKEVVIEAVKMTGSALTYASKELKNDKEVVMEAVKNLGIILQEASEELRSDKEVVLEAVKNMGSALQYTSEELKDDKEVVKEAVKSNGLAIQYASDRLKSDRELVFLAVKLRKKSIYGKSLGEEFDNMSANEAYLYMEAAQNLFGNIDAIKKENVPQAAYETPLIHVNPIFFKDKEIVIESIRQNNAVYFLPEIPQELKDKEVKAERYKSKVIASKIYRKKRKEINRIHRMIGGEITEEEEFDEQLKKIRNHLLNTEFTEEELKNYIKFNETEMYTIINNIDINIKDTRNYPEIFENKELIKKYIEKNNSCDIMKNTTSRLKGNEEFILEMINDYPEIIYYISNKLKKNKEFIEKAIQINKDVENYIR